MTKLAILIGVSEYDQLQKLPACTQDVELIQELLKSAGPFDDTLILTEALTRSSIFKSSISTFFSKYSEDKNIEELFFYFSGHGMTVGDNFNFILSDYDPKKMHTTSYANSELDETIRSLNPKLTVKIVDACQSGQQYIKDAQDLKAIFDKGDKKTLQSLYFLFSCASDQSSYCDSTYSDFTKCLAMGIANHGVEDVRYKDLIDFAADNFQTDLNQKPYFVIQANNTDVFGSFSKINKEKITSLIEKPPVKSTIPANKLTLSVADILKEKAKEYLNEKEIIEALIKLQKTIFGHAFSHDVSELFEIHFNAKENADFTPFLNAARYANKNKDTVLAKIKFRPEIRRVPINNLARFLEPVKFLDKSNEKDYTERVFQEPYKFEHLLSNLPFFSIDVDLVSKLPNLSGFTCSLIYLLTRTEISVFSSIAEIKFIELIGNKKIEYKNNKQYQYMLRNLYEDEIASVEIMNDFESYVHTYIRNAAGILEPVTETLENIHVIHKPTLLASVDDKTASK